MRATPDEGTTRREDEALRDAYDRVPYPSAAYRQTHPDTLATIAVLHGLDPPPVATGRILELGCSDGGNLLPMAAGLPDAELVGIDLSPRQIAEGRRRVRLLGLDNVSLAVKSILDVDESMGRFDYVIAHGVFSWVPEAVQEKLLAVCHDNLTDRGLAYVSYNTYPGWHRREMIREVARFHGRRIEGLEERAAATIELVELLAAATAAGEDDHALFLAKAAETIGEYRERPTFVAHEYLEESNRPCYFYQLVERARAHGLVYVGEAGVERLRREHLPEEVGARLDGWAADSVELEQYLDFITNSSFRRSVFCCGEGPLFEAPVDAALARLHVTSGVEAGGGVDLAADSRVEFRSLDGKSFSSTHPVAKATLARLGAAWPSTVPFPTLARAVAEDLDQRSSGGGEATTGDIVADFVHTSYHNGVVELFADPVDSPARPPSRPRVSPMTRLQAAEGLLLTSAHHRSVKIDDRLARELLVRLDGTNDVAALVELLDERLEAGGAAPPREQLEAAVRSHLDNFARYGLLLPV